MTLHTNTDPPAWRLTKTPPSPSPLPRRFWHGLLLARYRFEVTFSAYMMSSTEKACLYAMLVALMLIGLALASYPARLLLALILRAGGNSDMFYLPATSTTNAEFPANGTALLS